MRGTLNRLWPQLNVWGIIPAYVGNTIVGEYFVEDNGDHPRVCGEHPDITRLGRTLQGSSPRMRGTLNRLWPQLNVWGIIPAYAGNTSSAAPRVSSARDHPRVCGEHMREMERAGESPGSSPRMRGTHIRREHETVRPGIIPAYAGNTYPSAGIRSYTWDHPRVCGEHNPVVNTATGSAGSSPRMRGTLSGKSV